MSIAAAAGNLHRLARIAAIAAALPLHFGPAWADAGNGSPQTGSAATVAASPLETLIARVVVNGMPKGDLPIVRDSAGHMLVPAAEYSRWKLALPDIRPIAVHGEPHVDISAISGLTATFDPASVTLDIRVVAQAFQGTRVDLAPRRRPDTEYPSEASVFLNYGFNASGDADFGQRQYQFATELGARVGDWLFYNTTSQTWGNSAAGTTTGFTRLITNLQHDDRANLRRLTLGDFFTPSFDLSAAVPMAGVSLTKYYSMDPYFVQYPTASFRTEVALPSTVVTRIDGNVVDQRQVQPGPLDVSNITGVTGAQNVSVVVRDPFGREQVLQQPFFFATNAGLAEGLHEYSYNLGFLRRQYGIDSDDYGGLAVSAFHRYAFTNELTLGLRGQAASGSYNFGPFGSYQSPRLGLIAAGVSVGGGSGQSGPGGSLAYTYTGNNVSLSLGARYLAREYAQLSDLTSAYRTRSDQYGTISAYDPMLGNLAVTYTGTERYDGPTTRIWIVGYTRAALAGKGLLSLTYTKTVEPASAYTWLLSFRYYFDSQTSMAAGVGGTRHATTETVSLDRATPQGEGIGYSLTGAHVSGGDRDGGYGQGFVQLNAEHVTVGANYARSSAGDAGPSFSQLFVAGSIGAVGGRTFAARPVQDSFALVRVPGPEGIPVYANGWYAGKTDGNGEVVATNLASYYDNFISFSAADVSFDCVFDRAERVISPPARSGTLVAFSVRQTRAVSGTLVADLGDGKRMPLEMRDTRLSRGDVMIAGFTARRGEFYFEGLEPGDYLLQVDAAPACAARVAVPEGAGPMTELGIVICRAAK
jgi:outer membrane usher protein FimD/PapC